MRVSLLSLLFLLLSSLGGTAQQHSLLPALSELSDHHVTALTRDASGNIWVGTAFGLNRYNGSTFKPYFQVDSLGLRDDGITALLCDRDGTLWVGTNAGIDRMDRGRVVPSAHIPAGRIFSLCGREPYLIYSTRGTISVLDTQTGESRVAYKNKNFSYNSMRSTRSGYLWVFHLNRPLFTILDRHFSVVRELEIPGLRLHHYEEASDGRMYLCTDKGILCYSPDGVREELPARLKPFAGSPVLFYVQDPDGPDMFLGVQGKGIYSLDSQGIRQEWPLEKLPADSYSPVLLTGDNLWLSPDGKGLRGLYRREHDQTLPIPSDRSPDALNMFYEDGPGHLLVVTNRGLYRMRLSDKSYQRISLEGLGPDSHLGITLRDSRGRFWLLCDNRELRCYLPEGLRYRLVARYPAGGSSSIWEDAAGRVNFLLGEDVLQIQPDGSSRRILVNGHPDFWFAGSTPSGTTYFLSGDAVWTVNEQLHFSRIDTGIPAPSCLTEDRDGNWWVGTERDGLFFYDRKNESITPVPLGSGLVDKKLRSVTLSPDGAVWLSRRQDVVRVSPGEWHLTLFTREVNRYSTNSALSLADGTVVMGAMDRLELFSAHQDQAEADLPLALDGILVNGVPVDEDPLVLDHKHRQISFFYSARNFDPDIEPLYSHFLEGYDPDWVFSAQTLRAGYSGLTPGEYTFRVRVMLPSGQWSPRELAFPFRVKPSPWLSPWAIVLYSLLLLALAAYIIRLVIHLQVARDKQDLAQQERMLSEQMAQERTNFFTNVSHEFRTPLSLIYGPVKELSASPNLTGEDRKLARIVERNSERMVRLTDQLLQFSRSAESRDELSIRRVNLSRMLSRMLENFEYLFRQKSLRVRLQVPEVLDAYCDREKVEKVVFNLLSNAVKYTPDHGSIDVSLFEENGLARISVADTGIGITPDKLSRIFERYERLEQRVGDSLPTGFGIGLNFARHLAQVHKGSLEAAPNHPLGTVFSFSFPIRKEDYEGEAAIWEEEKQADGEVLSAETVETDGKKPHVLLAEDNPDMRTYIRTLLQEDFDVVLAADGEEAWKCIRIEAPDLVVSDIMMPYKDGYTLCKELKNDPEYCHLPIILLTAKSDMESRIQGLELGADAYIAKPFDPQHFRVSIQNLLANRRRMQRILSESPSALESVQLGTRDKAFLEKMYGLIEENLSDEEFNVTTLALELGMSRTSLFSKLKSLLGQSPQFFLINYRLTRAMELLKEGELNVSEVAYKVGFSTLTGFSRSFKNKFGIPPSSV